MTALDKIKQIEGIKNKINPDAFYHLTLERNLQSILDKGLLPANDIDDSIKHGGYNGDPNYVYLFSTNAVISIIRSILNGGGGDHDFALFEIELPDHFPIERDYHSAITSLNQNEDKEDKREHLVSFFEGLGVEFTGNLSKENIYRHVDMVTPERWIGTFRTPSPITTKYIIFREWEYFK
ncbi:hypothetical protein [Fodinibius halophilus]|uniref:Uncharacterized protein n=1 Tax=Fodinibius halophilus TaxID=1736908 RepID=A0A6M1TCB2_9BACT|nr:hypothetical protein [Fodinibius halophilus]NGP90003.1 hypothetical protein [Fodinibius halophilus]